MNRRRIVKERNKRVNKGGKWQPDLMRFHDVAISYEFVQCEFDIIFGKKQA